MSTKKKYLADFYRNERDRMNAFVRRLIDDTAHRDSEDVVQDVMLGIWDTADVTIPFDRLSAYVYRSLRNRVIDILRSRKKTVSIDAPIKNGSEESLADILPDLRYDAANGAETEEMKEAIFEVLGMLKSDERRIIILTEFDGRSFEECSKLLGEPVGTLLSRKSRTMKKIRVLLGEYSIFTED